MNSLRSNHSPRTAIRRPQLLKTWLLAFLLAMPFLPAHSHTHTTSVQDAPPAPAAGPAAGPPTALHAWAAASAWPLPRQEPAPQQYVLAASYYSLKGGLSATLMFNNKSPHPTGARLTLFSLAGERLDVPYLSVEGVSHLTVDLREYVPAGSPFEEGSLQVAYYGRPLQMGAQVRLVDAARGLSFDEQFTYPAQAASTRLEGVWWLPSRTSDARLVLSNRTEEALTVTARVEGRGPEDAQPLELLPRETRVLDLHAFQAGPAQRPLLKAGGVSVEHSGPKGGVIGRLLVSDPATGYSAVSELADPIKSKTTSLHGAGLRLREGLAPVVVARNVGDRATTVSGLARYTAGDGTVVSIALPAVQLKPGQTREINAAASLRRAQPGEGTGALGLEFDYAGAPGSVVMAAYSVGAGGEQVFRVPLLDPGAQRSSTGGYPLVFDDERSTVVYLKNTTGQQQRYVAHLKAEGVTYMIGQKTIEPGQTVAYDVRALRDEQTPDEAGRTIPPNATRGHFKWSVLLEEEEQEQLVMVGRAEHFDLSGAASSSYACVSCCPDSTIGSFLDPIFNVEVDAGTVVDFDAHEIKEDCYGDQYTSERLFASWSTSDSSVATVDSSGTVTTHDAGEIDVEAFFGGRYYYPYTCPGFESPDPRTRCGSCTSEPEPQRPRRTVRVRPVIQSITPARGPIGVGTSVTIRGRGFGTNPTVTISGTGVTYSGSSGSATELTGTINVAPDAAGGNRTVRIGSRGQTSNGVNFFVQIPSSLRVLSSGVFSGTGLLANGCPSNQPFGFRVSVRYQVLDQASPANPISATLPLREDLINFMVDGQSAAPDLRNTLVTASGTTESDGTFTDQPVGGCATGPFSTGSFEQTLFLPLSASVSPTVRVNNWAFSGRHSCGTMSNGVDVTVTVQCP